MNFCDPPASPSTETTASHASCADSRDSFFADNAYCSKTENPQSDFFAEQIAFEATSVANTVQNRMALVLAEIHGKYTARIWQLEQENLVMQRQNETSGANLKRKFRVETEQMVQSLYAQMNQTEAKKKRTNFCDIRQAGRRRASFCARSQPTAAAAVAAAVSVAAAAVHAINADFPAAPAVRCTRYLRYLAAATPRLAERACRRCLCTLTPRPTCCAC
eukprot:3932304-Rhodomonas_salina.1